MKKDIYVAYIGAHWVAFAWVGAVLSPILLLIGAVDKSLPHALIGAGMLLVTGLSIRDGFTALRAGVRTDFVAFSVVPLVLLPCGVGLAVAAYMGFI